MASMKLLKRDVLGRVRTPRAKREEILDEFEGSGVSGAEFAELAGIKYPTLASWIRRRRLG
jgi:DNA-binding transcriptional regulator YiaG